MTKSKGIILRKPNIDSGATIMSIELTDSDIVEINNLIKSSKGVVKEIDKENILRIKKICDDFILNKKASIDAAVIFKGLRSKDKKSDVQKINEHIKKLCAVWIKVSSENREAYNFFSNFENKLYCKKDRIGFVTLMNSFLFHKNNLDDYINKTKSESTNLDNSLNSFLLSLIDLSKNLGLKVSLRNDGFSTNFIDFAILVLKICKRKINFSLPSKSKISKELASIKRRNKNTSKAQLKADEKVKREMKKNKKSN
jgi:hypothetical protein